MPPDWVLTAEDYTLWVERVVAHSGGFVPGGLAFNFWPATTDEENDSQVLDLLPCRLFFHDGSFLDFSLQVDTDLSHIDYRFHYAPSGGGMFWRKDMHHGHEDDDGQLFHIHCSVDERRPYDEVDVEEAIGEALQQLWHHPTYHPCNDA